MDIETSQILEIISDNEDSLQIRIIVVLHNVTEMIGEIDFIFGFRCM